MIETSFETVRESIYSNARNWYEESIHPEGKKCYIFFSSNGLYSESTAEGLQRTLVERNRYEWTSMANAFKYHKELGKIIYVRDIYEAFYIYGISKQLDSIDKVIDKLKELTAGYQVTTVGISSGGYMAVICAAALHAERAFCFSGQFDIESHLKESDLSYCSSVEDKRKYINILNVVKQCPAIPIYYFCPIGCGHDYVNYQMVKDEKNVRSFLFPDKVHAATVYPFNFPDLLFLSNGKMDKLNASYKNKIINKNIFYLQTVSLRGVITFICYIFKTKFRIDMLKKKWDV